MGLTNNKFDLALGIVLVVLGVLLLLDMVDIPMLALIVGIGLIVVGVLMLVKKKGLIVALVLIGLGVLMLASDQFQANVAAVLTIVIGVLLILGGLAKMLGKW